MLKKQREEKEKVDNIMSNEYIISFRSSITDSYGNKTRGPGFGSTLKVTANNEKDALSKARKLDEFKLQKKDYTSRVKRELATNETMRVRANVLEVPKSSGGKNLRNVGGGGGGRLPSFIGNRKLIP